MYSNAAGILYDMTPENMKPGPEELKTMCFVNFHCPHTGMDFTLISMLDASLLSHVHDNGVDVAVAHSRLNDALL